MDYISNLKVLNGIDMFATVEQFQHTLRNIDTNAHELNYWIDEAFSYFTSDYYPRKKKTVIEKFKLYTQFISALQQNYDALDAQQYVRYANTLMNMALLTDTQNSEVNTAIANSCDCLELHSAMRHILSREPIHLPWLLDTYFDGHPERLLTLFRLHSTVFQNTDEFSPGTKRILCEKVCDVISSSGNWAQFGNGIVPILIMYSSLAVEHDDLHYKMMALYWKSQQLSTVSGSIDDLMVLDNIYNSMSFDTYGPSYKSLVDTAKALDITSDYQYWKSGKVDMDVAVSLPELGI